MEENFDFFIDLDKVLIDFCKGYEDLTGVDIRGEFYNDKNFWEPINKAGYKFWVNLEWMEDGKELWEYVKKYNPCILSAPSNKRASIIGKLHWVKRELPGVKLILRSSVRKKKLAKPNAVLIDDRLEIIESWREAGGIGIHHTNTKDTIEQLKKINL